jgi:PAS domain S-box-containing protein
VDNSGHVRNGALALALACEVVLAVIDSLVGDEVVFTSAYVLAPVALAIAGRWRQVAIAGIAATALAIASGWWNDYAGTADHLMRIAIVAAGSALATLAARALGRASADRARMQVLAAVGRLNGTEAEQDALEGLKDALVPAVATATWVDIPPRDQAGEIDAPERILETASIGEPLNDATRHTLEDGEPRRFEHQGAVVPLKSADTTIGALGLQGDYDDRDLEFFEILAGRVALVLANVRLVSDLRSTRARLDGILGALAEAVTVHDERGQTVYANDAAAVLLGKPTKEDVLAARPGELAKRFSIAKEDGSPVQLDEFPGRRLVKGEPGPELLTRSVDRVTGRAYWLLTKATALHDRDRTYAVNIMEDVTQAKEAELRQRFLAQAGQLLASSLDYEQTLQRVARLAVPWLADWCAVDMLGEHGDIQQVALAHVDPTKVAMANEFRRRYPPSPDDPTGVAGVLRGGPAELYPEVPEELIEQSVEDPEQLEIIKAIGIRAGMVLPMRVGEETVGAITLVSADSGRTFDEDDFAFAQDIALRAGTAVQNARLYREQARVAHTLQNSLLPERLPEHPDWATAASYQAGERGTEVGGDFYDIAPAAGGGQLVFLGDVTGKGIAAAALTALVRHSVRTAARFDPRPAAVLKLVNDVLLELPRLSPVTLVCALIEGSRLTVAAGGHPRPLLKRHGEVSEIGRHGALLGAIDGFEVEEFELDLETGDTLLLYTDGVTDTPGEHDRFGHVRLMEILRAAGPEPAAVLERVETALREFQTGSAIDDRAILVLRYAGDRSPALKIRSGKPILRST